MATSKNTGSRTITARTALRNIKLYGLMGASDRLDMTVPAIYRLLESSVARSKGRTPRAACVLL